MNFRIREANIDDAKGKGYVHYQSWIETYTGLIDQRFMDTRSLEKCVVLAEKYPDNTYVAEVEDMIIGFSCFSETRDEDANTGEIMAIYVLKEYFGLGIGKELMDVCYQALKSYPKIALWVLKENKHAIDFYKHIGFELDGNEKEVALGDITTINEVRLVRENPYYK